MKAVVHVSKLTKEYTLGKTRVRALDKVDLTIPQGDFIAVAGPSGSGKSTLLNLIGCLDRPTSGRIDICGQDVVRFTPDQLADLRNHKIGFIFQTFNLIPVLTAFENVEFPLLLTDCSPRQRRQRVLKAMDDVELSDQTHHKPDELSGGQRQRVAIARALVKDPEIVLADEPTANLDSDTGHTIIQLMYRLCIDKGTTFLFSTHDEMVMAHASKVTHLQDGRLTPAAKV